jgi:predicted amidohydrolase YtcJ
VLETVGFAREVVMLLQFGSRCLLVVGLGVLLFGCGPAEEPADLVLMGGRIVTMDEALPEAEALAARGGTIVAMGTEAEIRKLVGPETQIVDLEGGLAVPGLIEAHGHFLGLGRARMQLDLTTAQTWDEIVDMVGEAAADAPDGQWILGRGWHQEKWRTPPDPAIGGLPLHDALSAATPSNPVMLTHASGHAVIVNARAMAMAGIDDATPDPPGGQIVRGGDGVPIGVLRETAEDLVARLVDSGGDEATLRRAAELAGEACLANGITSFQDAGTAMAQVELLRTLAASDGLAVRLWVMLSDSNEILGNRLSGYRVHREGDNFLTVGGIKRLSDGALGAHGAWLLEPYDDLPGSTGLNIVTPDELQVTADLAARFDLQLCTHAIGDRANRETLDVYERALSSRPDGRERRWRVEHAQHLHPDDIARFGELGVIAAMQAIHCTSDGPWVPARLGNERAEQGAYVWRALLDSGATIANGTDTPVEDIDPIANFHAAVTRRMNNGSEFYPEQVMTRLEALRAATIDAAYAAFEEDIKGSLSPGKLADITVLSQDVLVVPDHEIPGTRVLYTIVGGEVKYSGRS